MGWRSGSQWHIAHGVRHGSGATGSAEDCGFHTLWRWTMAQRQISPGRQVVFYFGVGLSVLGFVVFISVFFSAAGGMGEMRGVESGMSSMMMRAIAGMVMMMVGGVMTGIGRMGLAGAGVVLDPELARRDVEPWARMAGGVVKDAMDEAGVRLGGGEKGAAAAEGGAADRAAGMERVEGVDASALPIDERLRRLEKLRAEGLVSAEEYSAARKRILESV